MAKHNLYINHLFTPMKVGSLVEMHRWPEHVTLAGNFFTDAALSDVLSSLEDLCSRHRVIQTQVEAEAAFGEAGEYPVLLLAYPPEFIAFQEDLAAMVETLPGYFEAPHFAGAGYHPHTTIQPGSRKRALGQKVVIDTATLFDIDVSSNTRSVLATFLLAPN